LTIYGKYKLLSEEQAFELADKEFIVTVARPGTVAGFSPRQRFDLIVNIFTNHAMTKKKLIIEGGKQKRPIVNIADLCLAYEKLLTADYKKINREAFNIVGENLTVEQIAKKVAKLIPGTKIEYIEKFDDKRSYFTSGQKIHNLLNFKPTFSIEDAIFEISGGLISAVPDDS
jgi:nucleoside-diphosphate-sugar epimerase